MVAPRAQTRLSSPEVLAKTNDLPVEVFEQSTTLDRFRPDLVSPAAVFLAHESCTLDGEVLVAGGGQVMRIAVVQNEGFTKETVTAEDIAANLDAVMDLSDAKAIKVSVMQGEH
jgi:hypothetical protein